MLTSITDLPAHVFGVTATGEVTADDLKNVLLPGLQALSEKQGEIYYLLVLKTDVENFTVGAWLQDMIAGIKNFTKWQKIAVVTDQKAVEKFTDAFSFITPGDAKGYKLTQLEEAKAWLAIKS